MFPSASASAATPPWRLHRLQDELQLDIDAGGCTIGRVHVAGKQNTRGIIPLRLGLGLELLLPRDEVEDALDHRVDERHLVLVPMRSTLEMSRMG